MGSADIKKQAFQVLKAYLSLEGNKFIFGFELSDGHFLQIRAISTFDKRKMRGNSAVTSFYAQSDWANMRVGERPEALSHLLEKKSTPIVVNSDGTCLKEMGTC